MNEFIKNIIRTINPHAFLKPEGQKGILEVGHRDYVGGLWDEIGRLQFDFLVTHGMEPTSYLLDIACGSLRLGVKAIPYLDPGHYLGIEKEEGLVQAGLEKELDPRIRAEKQPHIVISSAFEFSRFGKQADYAIAQSLFTHLPSKLIRLCFRNLHPALKDNGVFFATFFETETRRHNPSRPHDHGYFAYTRDEMCAFGSNAGFAAEYIGQWNHPRKQVMMEYRKGI